jgi:predicted Zn-dependent protease
MTNPATTSLLDRANLDRDSVRHELARGLSGADDGELFLEYSQTEALMFDNGRLKQATYDTSQGFGLRAVKDDAVGYAHSSDVSLPALIRAADAVAAAIRAALQVRPPTPMCGSTATTIRLTRRASKARSSFWPRSTPMSATRIRGYGR